MYYLLALMFFSSTYVSANNNENANSAGIDVVPVQSTPNASNGSENEDRTESVVSIDSAAQEMHTLHASKLKKFVFESDLMQGHEVMATLELQQQMHELIRHYDENENGLLDMPEFLNMAATRQKDVQGLRAAFDACAETVGMVVLLATFNGRENSGAGAAAIRGAMGARRADKRAMQRETAAR